MIPIEECVRGTVYKLRSRNLDVGVFDGKDSFIGWRQKFGSVFLDEEYHYDPGPNGTVTRGTARPLEAIDKISDHIVVKVYLGSRDSVTGRFVDFDKPISSGGVGWYFIDTGEASQDIRPQAVTNKALYAAMEKFRP